MTPLMAESQKEINSLLTILLYISTVILWPLYQFNEEFGGQSQQSSVVSCSDELAYDMCL